MHIPTPTPTTDSDGLVRIQREPIRVRPAERGFDLNVGGLDAARTSRGELVEQTSK